MDLTEHNKANELGLAAILSSNKRFMSDNEEEDNGESKTKRDFKIS